MSSKSQSGKQENFSISSLAGEALHEIILSTLWGYDKINRKINIELWADGLVGTPLMEVQIEPKDTGNKQALTFETEPIDLTGLTSIDFYVYSSQAGDICTINNATIKNKRWI